MGKDLLSRGLTSDSPSTWPKGAATVALVGAGPGDPGLITVRGRQLLERADVVIYDYLSNPALLRYCPQAECIYVGKKAAAHSMTQDQINALLVEHGRTGRRVVRLKGGDPFIFGRGGEECLALADAGIAFEIVPGITAAILLTFIGSMGSYAIPDIVGPPTARPLSVLMVTEFNQGRFNQVYAMGMVLSLFAVSVLLPQSNS